MEIKNCPKCKSNMVYLKVHHHRGCEVHVACVGCVCCGNRITVSDKNRNKAIKKSLELWEDLENGN